VLRITDANRPWWTLALGDALWLIVVLCGAGTLLTWWLVRAPELGDAARPAPPRTSHAHH
jgi:hypothetical protein